MSNHVLPCIINQLKIKIMMNVDLLKELYTIFSPSGDTKKMRSFLKRAIKARGGDVVQDKKGNLLVTKGKADTYPCLSAHIDQVRNHTHPKDFQVLQVDNILMGWSTKLKQQCGLGADDKNGVFICLNALEKYDNIKIAFFVDEEIGCCGSSAVDMSFFDDCRFVIEPDRRDGYDFISCMSGVEVCSDDFIKASGFENFGYKFDEGSVTDVLTLLERGLKISCLNLSCGYYHPHTDQEVTDIDELENCQNLVFHMIETMTDVYPFEYNDGWGSKNKGYIYGYDSGYNIMDDIVANNPELTFEDIMEFKDEFLNKDEKYLRELYEDVRVWYPEEPDEDKEDVGDNKSLIDWRLFND